MSADTLARLLERNRGHVESLADDHFAAVVDGQAPEVVSVCCSDSRVSQEGMFDVTDPGWLFTPSVIGNQVRDRVDGELVVEGSCLFPLANTGTEVAAVVGHTQCGAITAAYDVVRASDDGASAASAGHPPGIAKWIDLLVPIVEDGLAGPVDEAAATDRVIDELVEYNVREQVAFLDGAEAVRGPVDVYGFVYDFTGRYGDRPGRTYLVAADGTTDPAELEGLVDETDADAVRSLLA